MEALREQLAQADRIIATLRSQVREIEARHRLVVESLEIAAHRCLELEEARLAAHERADYWRKLFLDRCDVKRKLTC